MKSEKQELLDRVLLMMKYDSKNTLSENIQKNKKILNESVDSLYNQSVTIDNYFKNFKIYNEFSLQSSDNNNLITKEVLSQELVKFSCEIQKTSVGDLISLLMKKADTQNVYPTSEMFYASERGNNITITMWLIETNLFASLKYRISNKQLTNKDEHNWGWLIRVPIGTKTETKYKEEYVDLKRGGEGYTKKTPYQVVTTERLALFNFNDARYQDYVQKLQNNTELPISPEKNAIPYDEWMLKLKNIYSKDIGLDIYSICNAKNKGTQGKEEKKTSVKIGCPFSSVEEENDFRQWVDDTYPDIARDLELNIAAPANNICNDYVIKALNYFLTADKWVKYKHPGV